MIKTHKESEDFAHVTPENCTFCKIPTRMWEDDGEYPVCDHCANIKNPSDLPKNKIMDNKQILNSRWVKGVRQVFPTHHMVQHWLFTEDTEEQAILANQIAIVAEKNGLTRNDLQNLFPAILRILNDKSEWSK